MATVDATRPDYADLPTGHVGWRRNTTQPTHFHAGHNDPGYLPESEPGTFASFAEAKDYMLSELRFHAENLDTWAEPHDCDDVPCPYVR